MKQFTISFFLAVLSLISFAAPVMIGVDGSGNPLTAGSGGFVFNGWKSRPAIVENNGDVLFLAKVSGNGRLGTYRFREGKTACLHPGQEGPMIFAVGMSNFNLVRLLANPNEEHAYAILAVDNSTSYPTVIPLSSDGTPGTHADCPTFGKIDVNTLDSAILYSASPDCATLGFTGQKSLAVTDTTVTPQQYEAVLLPKDDYTYLTPRRPAADATGRFIFDFRTSNDGTTGTTRIVLIDTFDDSETTLDTVLTNFKPSGASSRYIHYAACSSDATILYYTTYAAKGTTAAQIVRMVLEPDTHTIINSRIITRDAHGDLANNSCEGPACSEDGEYLVFTSAATNLGADSQTQVFRYAAASNALTCLSQTDDAEQADAPCSTPAISPNGRIITFTSGATNLGSTPPENCQQLYCVYTPVDISADDISAFPNTPAAITFHGNPIESAQIRLASCTVGKLIAADDTDVPVNTAVPFAETATWRFISDTLGSGTITFEITEDNGISWQAFSCTAAVKNASVSYVSLTDANTVPSKASSTMINNYRGVSATSSLSKALFVTNAKLTSGLSNEYSAFARTISPAATQLLKTGGSLSSASQSATAISGDGSRYVVFLDNKVLAGNCLDDFTGLTSRTLAGAPVFSYDGSVIVFCEGSTLYRQVHNQAAEALATDAQLNFNKNTTLKANWDASIILYTSTTGLKALFASDHSSRTLAGETDLSEFGLSLSGKAAFYRKGNTFTRHGIEADATPQTILENSNLLHCTVSADTRYVFWTTSEASGTLYRAAMETPESADMIDTHCQNMNQTAFVPAADGSAVVYVSSTPHTEEDTNETEDLLMATLITPEPSMPAITASCQEDLLENTTAVLKSYDLAVQCTPSTPDAVIRLTQSQSTAGCGIALQAPTADSPAQTIRYTPFQYFCGADSINAEVWTGTDWLQTTLAITVKNVNTPPFLKDPSSSIETIVAENDTNAQIDLKSLTDDWDFHYYEGAASTEHHTFSLNNDAPTWASIHAETGVISLDLTGQYDVVHRGGGDFTLHATVTDAAGATLPISVTVHVTNVNRPPVLAAQSAATWENTEIPWSLFGASDPDEEDTPETLTIVVTDADGNIAFTPPQTAPSTSGIPYSDFPIAISATKPNLAQRTYHVCAQDIEGARSQVIPLTITFNTLTVSGDEILNGVTDEHGNVVGRLETGWNLLASPFDLSEPETTAFLTALNVSTALHWDSDSGKLRPVTSLQADEGFFALVTKRPEAISDMTGKRSYHAPSNGWNLRGSQMQFTFRESNVLDAKTQHYIKGTPLAPTQGAWFFVTGK